MLHSDRKLTLVFEHCDQDLKKYFDSLNGEIDAEVVKSFMYVVDFAVSKGYQGFTLRWDGMV